MTLFWGICGAVVAYIVIKKFFPDDVRDCPHCYSKIPKKATVCKHCKTKVEKYKVDKKSSSADKLELVEELSEITGAKQSDSLSALKKANYDLEAAIELLRDAGKYSKEEDEKDRQRNTDKREEDIVDKKYSIDGISFKSKSDFDDYIATRSDSSSVTSSSLSSSDSSLSSTSRLSEEPTEEPTEESKDKKKSSLFIIWLPLMIAIPLLIILELNGRATPFHWLLNPILNFLN